MRNIGHLITPPVAAIRATGSVESDENVHPHILCLVASNLYELVAGSAKDTAINGEHSGADYTPEGMKGK